MTVEIVKTLHGIAQKTILHETSYISQQNTNIDSQNLSIAFFQLLSRQYKFLHCRNSRKFFKSKPRAARFVPVSKNKNPGYSLICCQYNFSAGVKYNQS